MGITSQPIQQISLKKARELKGWTQTQLQRETVKLGARVDQRLISKLEIGRIQDPRNSTVESLETALGLRRGSLVFGRAAKRVA